MRTTTLLLAAAVAVFLVIVPQSAAKPYAGAYVKSEKSQSSAEAGASQSSSSQEEVKANGATGVYEAKSSKSDSKAAYQKSQSSSESYEANIGGSCGCKTQLTEEEIKTIYAKKECETEEVYYKRIVERTSSFKTIEEYVSTLTTVRKIYPNLLLWYSTKYYDLVKEYYTALYKQRSDETIVSYYKRITTKDLFENEEQFAQRVFLVHYCYPKLPLWYDDEYFNTYTKAIYAAEFKRLASESDEVYIERVLKQYPFDYCTDIWAKRVYLTLLGTNSFPLWYDVKYYKFTKTFYEAYYKKQESEKDVNWLIRVLTPLFGESEEYTFKRLSLLRSSLYQSVWTEAIFNQVLSSKTCSLSKAYLTKIQEAFFSTTTIEKKSSSSSSSSSSASASKTEESTVIKC